MTLLEDKSSREKLDPASSIHVEDNSFDMQIFLQKWIGQTLDQKYPPYGHPHSRWLHIGNRNLTR